MNLTQVLAQQVQSRSASYIPKPVSNPITEVSRLLGKAQSKADITAFNAVHSYHRSSENVVDKLRKSSVNTCLKFILSLNNEFSIAKDLFGEELAVDKTHLLSAFRQGYDECYDDWIHKMLREELKSRINNCLLLAASKSAQPVNKAIRCDDGRYRNNKLRSLFNQLYGTAIREDMGFSAFTVKLHDDFSSGSVSAELADQIKRKLVYHLKRLFTVDSFAGAFSFEISKNKETHHIHGLILYPKAGKASVQAALKTIAAEEPSSVCLQTQYKRKRFSSFSEMATQLRGGSENFSLTVDENSAITMGMADYISKDLYKYLGRNGKQSRIVTFSTQSVTAISLSDYHKARTGLLQHLAERVQKHWELFDQDSIVDSLIFEPVLPTE